jgi:hypothetical protein
MLQNFKNDFREMRCEDKTWIELAQHRPFLIYDVYEDTTLSPIKYN